MPTVQNYSDVQNADTHLGYASFATITGDETLAAALRSGRERTADQSEDAFVAQTNPIVAKSAGKEPKRSGNMEGISLGVMSNILYN